MPWKRSKIDVVKFEGSTGKSENRIIASMAVSCLVYIATRAGGSELLSKHHDDADDADDADEKDKKDDDGKMRASGGKQ